jgi:hypothetical protein
MVLLFLTPLFYYVPNAALGAVIEVALFNLIDIKVRHGAVRYGRSARLIHVSQAMLEEYHRDRLECSAMVVAFVATLVLNTEYGLLVGVPYSLLVFYFTPRGGAALANLLWKPRHYRADHHRYQLDFIILDVARFWRSPPLAQRRLGDFLRFSRESGRGPRTLCLALDAAGLGSVGREEVAAIQALRQRAVAAGMPEELVLIANVQGEAAEKLRSVSIGACMSVDVLRQAAVLAGMIDVEGRDLTEGTEVDGQILGDEQEDLSPFLTDD